MNHEAEIRRIAIAVATITLAIGTGCGVAAAAHKAIEDRQALMKSLGIMTKEAVEVVKGQRPYDAERAHAIFLAYRDAATRLPTLFPPDSQEGGYTKAMPEIWADTAGFAADLEQFRKDADAALAAPADPVAFKAAVLKVNEDCKACHSDFRQ